MPAGTMQRMKPQGHGARAFAVSRRSSRQHDLKRGAPVGSGVPRSGLKAPKHLRSARPKSRER